MRIPVKCPTCIICGNVGRVLVNEEDFYKWQGTYDTPPMLAQDAFPYLNEDERELLISGTHKACWDLFIDDIESEANGDGLAGVC